jgi:hypothetical protein
MSSRCRCCESILSSHDLILKQEDGTCEDLCGLCRWYVYNDDILHVHSYAFENITERLIEYQTDKDYYESI